MKIVLDTNVLVSGIFFSGPPHRILDAWRSGRVQIVLSPAIIDEYRRVLDELSAKFEGIEVRQILELIISGSEIVEDKPLPKPICNDPDDDKFVAAALTGRADTIVSGDKHLLDACGHKDVAVLRPREFLDRYL